MSGIEATLPSHVLGRCPICDWPMSLTAREGCVPGNCAYRPEYGTDEYRRIQRNREAVSRRGMM